MKSRHSILFRLAVLIFAPFLYFLQIRRFKKTIFSLAVIVLLIGCFNHFYDTNSRNTTDKDFLNKLQQSSKVFIAHFADTIVQLTSLQAEESHVIAVAQQLPLSLRMQLNPSTFKPNKYKPKQDPTATTQVHLYTPENKNKFEQGTGGTLQIPITAFNRIDVYEENEARTKQSTVGSVFAIVGIVMGAVLVGFFIAFLIACNCPQVYVLEDGEYRFKSGLYSGAIYSTLERSDYLVLNSFPPSSDSLEMRIENVAGEQQFINRIQLMKVSHSAGTKVLTDRHGKIFSYKMPVSPVTVLAKPGDDFVNQVVHSDNRHAGFNYSEPGKSTSNLILKFPAKMAGTKARLVMRAANTMWAGYVYKEFRGLFGNSYSSWAGRQEKLDKSVAENWLINQSLPLKVYTQKQDGNWQYVDYFPMTGNTAMREMIMEVDLPSTPFQTIDIRLETVYRFWEIDFVALDNTVQESISSEWINPDQAELSSGDKVQFALTKQDTSYVRLAGKEYLYLKFRLENKQDANHTYFLSGTGYYHQAPLNDNKPDIQALLRFKEPGAFHAFSLEKYNTLSTSFAAHSTGNRK